MVNLWTRFKENLIFTFLVQPEYMRAIRERKYSDEFYRKEVGRQHAKFQPALDYLVKFYGANPVTKPRIVYMNSTKNDTQYQSKRHKRHDGSVYYVNEILMCVPFNHWMQHSEYMFPYMAEYSDLDFSEVKDREMFILLHELAHHFQYEDRRLLPELFEEGEETYIGNITFEGKVYDMTKYQSSCFGHMRLPWEIDANRLALAMYRELKRKKMVE